MNLKRWLSVILTMGLLLVLSPLGAQADPPFDRYYQHPRGNAYGWHGPRPHEFERHRNYYRRGCGPQPRYVRDVYVAQPPVALVAPVAPMMVPQAQPYYSQPSVPNGLHGSLTFGY